jgi:hypothetical protein
MSTLAIIAIVAGAVVLLALVVSFARRGVSARAAALGRRRVEAAEHRSQASGHAQRAEELHADAVGHRERAEEYLERADELDELATQHAGEAGARSDQASRVEP